MTNKKIVLLICTALFLLSTILSLSRAQGNQPTANFIASPTSGHAPLTVNFTDLSTPHDNITDWEWDFTDDGTVDSNETNPTYVYEQEGLYTVSLIVYDADGDNDTETKIEYINVNQRPVADANGPYTGTEGAPTTFDGSGSDDPDGDIVSYTWDLGDGTTEIFVGSNLTAFATHTYTQDGTYTVTLTVTDDDSATDTDTTSAMVGDTNPAANFSATQTSGPEPLTLIFTDLSTSYDGIRDWEWDFTDDGTVDSNETNPTHTYTQDGVYAVTLKVYDGDGDSDLETKVDYVTVTDTEPNADFSATPTSGSEPLQVDFTDLSTSYDEITSWTWDFGDGQTSTEQNPTHVYIADGAYTVNLTVVDEDGSSDVETEVNYISVADTAPTADFSYLPSSAALKIDFTDQSISYDELVFWTWDFGDGKTSTKQNPTHKFPDDDVYSVSLTVTDADDSTNATTKQVAVLNFAPTADFNVVSSPKPTINEDVTFLDQSSDPDGSVESWFWDLGDETNSTAQNVTHRYQAIGTFIVTLTVTDDDGATDATSKNVTIYDVVPPVTVDDYDGLWHTSDFTINLTATDDLSDVQTTYYRINDGSIMSVQVDGQPFISEEGYNKLEYWSVDWGGNEEAHQIIPDVKLDKTNPTANAGPDQVVDEDTPMTFDGSASYDNIEITNYTWAFFDEASQTLTGMKLTYTFNTPGNYAVTLRVTDAALHSATDTITITVIDITKPVANAGDDEVVHEDVTVTFDGSASSDNVAIVSYMWTFIEVTPQTLHGVNSTYVFDLPGVYNVTLTVSDAQGNLATDVVTITVVDATWPAADAGSDQQVDEDTLVSFDGSGSSDNVRIISYVWTFIDGTLQTMFGANPNYTFGTPGHYTVTLNVTDGEGHFTTDTVVVTVRDTTAPLVDAGSYVTVVENAPVNLDASGSHDDVAIVGYQWDFGDGTFENSTIPSAIHIYTKPGVYIVALTVVDEAGNVNATSISVVVHRDTDRDLIADHIDTDDDNDGMPDDWETENELDPLDPSDASLDRDGDGFSNLTEYQISSDPNVFTSPSPVKLIVVLVIATIGFVIFLLVLLFRKLWKPKSP